MFFQHLSDEVRHTGKNLPSNKNQHARCICKTKNKTQTTTKKTKPKTKQNETKQKTTLFYNKAQHNSMISHHIHKCHPHSKELIIRNMGIILEIISISSTLQLLISGTYISTEFAYICPTESIPRLFSLMCWLISWPYLM